VGCAYTTYVYITSHQRPSDHTTYVYITSQPLAVQRLGQPDGAQQALRPVGSGVALLGRTARRPRRTQPLQLPLPIDAPCTHCLRHGDPMHAQK
jgi:hypothetical protein